MPELPIQHNSYLQNKSLKSLFNIKDPIIIFVDFRFWSYWAIMFVNVRNITKQIGSIVVKA